MKVKAMGVVLLFLILASCKTPTEKWLDGMVDYKSIQGKVLAVEIRKVQPPRLDTGAITYSVRLFPAKEWNEAHGTGLNERLAYGMDSCFTVRTASAGFGPDMVQPVNNGIAGCYEYLVSFGVTKAMKYHPLELVYADRYIDKKVYRLELNR